MNRLSFHESFLKRTLSNIAAEMFTTLAGLFVPDLHPTILR